MFLAFCVVVPAAAAPRTSEGYPRVTADAATRLGPEGAPTLQVYAEICYDGLHFERSGATYDCRLEFALVANDRHGDQLGGDTWRRDISVTDYRETRSNSECFQETLSLELPPLAAEAALSVLDRRTGERSRVVLPFQPGGVAAGSWHLAELVFRRSTPEPPGPPHPTRVYGEARGDAVADLELYSTSLADSFPPADLAVTYRVEDWEGVEVAHGDAIRYRALARGSAGAASPASASYIVRQRVESLSRGLYTLEVRCRSRAFEGRTLAAREVFEVTASRAFWRNDYAEYVATLYYIAPAEEVIRLEDVSETERRAAWDVFWKRRDPTPGTPRNEREEEHLGRVAYADRHFGSMRRAGWESDRGRIYIVFGAPDDVERGTSTTGTEGIETWEYYRSGRRFVFRDTTGFGDYVLDGEWPR